jgi:hypothetical protein
MKRRFNPPTDSAIYQAAVDHKQASLNVILAQLPNSSTFNQIADLIGYSREWVRSRLVQSPHRLNKIGRNYRVPRGVAVEFVTSIFG